MFENTLFFPYVIEQGFSSTYVSEHSVLPHTSDHKLFFCPCFRTSCSFSHVSEQAVFYPCFRTCCSSIHVSEQGVLYPCFRASCSFAHVSEQAVLLPMFQDKLFFYLFMITRYSVIYKWYETFFHTYVLVSNTDIPWTNNKWWLKKAIFPSISIDFRLFLERFIFPHIFESSPFVQEQAKNLFCNKNCRHIRYLIQKKLISPPLCVTMLFLWIHIRNCLYQKFIYVSILKPRR